MSMTPYEKANKVIEIKQKMIIYLQISIEMQEKVRTLQEELKQYEQ